MRSIQQGLAARCILLLLAAAMPLCCCAMKSMVPVGDNTSPTSCCSQTSTVPCSSTTTDTPASDEDDCQQCSLCCIKMTPSVETWTTPLDLTGTLLLDLHIAPSLLPIEGHLIALASPDTGPPPGTWNSLSPPLRRVIILQV